MGARVLLVLLLGTREGAQRRLLVTLPVPRTLRPLFTERIGLVSGLLRSPVRFATGSPPDPMQRS